MSLGGLYDHLRGGFFRYSVDERWLIPHFEKMLYDTAQLIPSLATAWLATGEQLYRNRIIDSLNWLETEMRLEDGCYASSLDADTPQGEGSYYLWTPRETAEILGEDSSRFNKDYDITEQGNFEGKSLPNLLRAENPEKAEQTATESMALLRAAQDARTRPARDEKVLTDWNALAVTALCRAAQILDEKNLVARAQQIFARLTACPIAEIPHSRVGTTSAEASMATDHANLAAAAISLQQTTGNDEYLAHAIAHLDYLEENFADESGTRFHLAHRRSSDLITRPILTHDDATPNHNATIASVTARLATNHRR